MLHFLINTVIIWSMVIILRIVNRHNIIYGHNIIYRQNIIHIPFPPVFICAICNYSKVDVQNIQKAMLYFNLRKSFESLSVDSKVKNFNKTLLN